MSHGPDFTPWPAPFAERYRRAGFWNGRTLDDLLTSAAHRWPKQLAVVDGLGRRITYRELDDRVDSKAAALLGLGLCPGDRVIVQLPNRAEFVELLFGLFRLGVVPVLALPGHRRSELGYFARHAEARALFVVDHHEGFDHRALAREIASEAPTLEHLVVVGDADGLVPYAELEAPRRDLAPVASDGLALLQLSGGSTGTPKLIPRSHDDYGYSVRASARICGLSSRSRFLCALPPAHNYPLSSPGILGCIGSGSRVVLAPSPDPDTVFSMMDLEGVTLAAAVPALARLWLLAAQRRGWRPSSLEVLQVGGAKLPIDLARALSDNLGCKIQQVFGMAEGLVCYTRLDDGAERCLETQGRPISDADELRVLDGEDRELPPDTVGDLVVRGPYTIRSYFRAAEHDRVAFTADGFYRTGDRVRIRADGYLVVEGRSKEQINRGGEKVAPAEVEARLEAHPRIREAAVVGIVDPILGERVAAALVVEGQELSPTEVATHLQQQGLARFKHPDRIRTVNELPRTRVGKTDKTAVADLFARPRSSRS